MDISTAIVLWTGWGRTKSPSRDDALLIRECGAMQADRMLGEIRRLEDAFYSSDAHVTESDLESMGRRAADEFAAAHPEIGADAVHALAWCYTYDYR